MNEDEKNDWDRKAEELDRIIHLMLVCANPVENKMMSSAADYLASLQELERVKGRCQGLAEAHRVNEKTGREGA